MRILIDLVRSPEILNPKAKVVVGRILAISPAFNAKYMVHIENIVMCAMAPFVLLAGEYCIRRSARPRGLYRMRRQTLLSLRSLRQYWRQRQLPLSRIYYTGMMKTRRGLASYERMRSLSYSATTGDMQALWRTHSVRHHTTARIGRLACAIIDLQALCPLLARQVSM